MADIRLSWGLIMNRLIPALLIVSGLLGGCSVGGAVTAARPSERSELSPPQNPKINPPSAPLAPNQERKDENTLHGLPMKNVTARAATSWNGNTPDKAVDGDDATHWNSGRYVPASIELDLGERCTIEGLRLVPNQMPVGHTVHKIFISDNPIGNADDQATMACRIEGKTTDGQVIKARFSELINGRYVKVLTIESPSWVAWWEITATVVPAKVAKAK